MRGWAFTGREAELARLWSSLRSDAAGVIASESRTPQHSGRQPRALHPSGGSEVAVGSVVDLWVADEGPQPVVVPDVFGLTVEQAAAELVAEGLSPGGEVRVADGTFAPGTVLGSDPSAGTEVDDGTTVDLIVADGVPPDAPASEASG
jgi:hypothetical protein